MALSSAQGESGPLGPMDDAGAPTNPPQDAQPDLGGGSSAESEGAAAFKILSQPAEGQVMDNGDGTFSFDTGGDFQDLAVGETRQVSFTFLLERSEVVTATVVIAATPEGPVAKDVSYVSDGESPPAPLAEAPPSADQAPFDAAPMSDLGALAFADADAPESAPEVAAAPDFLAEPTVTPEPDHGDFGSEPMTPLADLDFATAPPSPAAEPEPAMPEPAAPAFEDTGDQGLDLVADMPEELPEATAPPSPAAEFEPAMPEPAAPAFEDTGDQGWGGQGLDLVADMPKELPEAMAPAPAAPEPLVDDLPPEGEIDILSQPEAGSVSNNGDGTFSFDPGAEFQDLADGEKRDVSFNLRMADGAVMTAVVTVAGDPAGPIAHDVTFLVQDDTPPADAGPAFDSPAPDFPDFDSPATEAPSLEEPEFTAPMDVPAAAPATLATAPATVDPWDQMPSSAATPDASAQAAAEPSLAFDASDDLVLDAPAASWEPEDQQPASDAADDFSGGGTAPYSSPDTLDQPAFAPDAPTPVEPMAEPEREPLPERLAAKDSAASDGFDSGFSGFSDFETAPAEAPADPAEPMDWAAEPTLDEEPAMPAAGQADDALPPAFGDFSDSFSAEPAPMSAETAPMSAETAAAEPAFAEPAFAAPAAKNEDDFAGMDGARRVDTLQLSGVTAGPGTGGWNIELSNGRIVDVQDGCVILAAGSSGTLVLDDSNVRVSFDGIERIVW